MNTIVLVWLALAFAWTALRGAGFKLTDWDVTVVALALLAAMLLPGSRAPRLNRWLVWPLALLTAWVLLQIVPLPADVVRLVSPARAELAAAAGDGGWVPISVFPALTLAAWTRLAGCVLVFLIVRELAWRYSDTRTPWVVMLPLVVVACLEAVLGLAQFYDGFSGAGAQGTYGSRDHFAGLMEMALPFPIMYGMAALWRNRVPFRSPLKPALAACGSFAAGALLLLGSIHSLSRMGFIAALFALAILGASALPKRFLFAAPAAVLLLFIYLPPNELIERFADLSSRDKIAAQDRLELWRETMPLIAAYPLTGCGLGTYESAFMRFKRSAPLANDPFAHNDYLQYAAELGLPAFLLGLLVVTGVVACTIGAASRHDSPAGRALALACLASMSALLLHSLVDFNSYIPGNAFAFAWVAGMAASVMFSSRPAEDTSPLTLEAVELPSSRSR